MSDKSAQGVEPVSFSEKLASSQAFAALFKEGMGLVEETASYLDGPGRQDSKKLERGARRTTRWSASLGCSRRPSSAKHARHSFPHVTPKKNPARAGFFNSAIAAKAYFLPRPPNFFWKRDRRPPRSSRCC